MRVAIAGCGDLGMRLARRLAAGAVPVLGLRRSAAPSVPGLSLARVDVTRLEPGQLADWGATALVIALSPDRRTPEDYRATYVRSLDALAAAFGASLVRCLLVSSTAVYGGEDGGWVDEDTAPAPARWNGAILLEAERRAAALLPGLVVCRLAGIYGPGRERMWRRALAGERGSRRWTNRIHAEDAAAALAHLLAVPAPGPCYNVSDDRPAPEFEVLDGLRALCGRPALGPVEGGGRGRRIRNARLRAAGWAPRYPGWSEGYAAELAARDGQDPVAAGHGGHRV